MMGCKDVDYDNNPFGKDVYWDRDKNDLKIYIVYTHNQERKLK